MRTPTKREWALLALAPAMILAAAGANREGDNRGAAAAESLLVGKPKGDAAQLAGVTDLELAKLRRDAKPGVTGDVFASKSWYVPPPQPAPVQRVVPMQPPPPSAPALPFTYLGRYEDQAKPAIFLVRGNRLLVVHAGDVIEGTYRVDGIAGTTLAMTYLPLNIRQTIEIGHAG
jgi:hypothetical protein